MARLTIAAWARDGEQLVPVVRAPDDLRGRLVRADHAFPGARLELHEPSPGCHRCAAA